MLNITSLDRFVPNWRSPIQLEPEGKIPTLALEWDGAAELFWTLRLCERFGVATAQWKYPSTARWVSEGQRQLSYSDLPVSTDASVQSRSSEQVKWEDDTLNFQITLHNDSSIVSSDTWCWVCLIHLWAGSFQANCELPVGLEENYWKPCAAVDAPRERWLKWCPVRERRAIAERIGRHQAYMWQPHVETSEGAVRAWRIVAERSTQQFIELSSPDTIILGWSRWPCTDVGLYFGSIEPGSSTAVEGSLRFFETSYMPI